MKCMEHPAADVRAYCQHCGKGLCGECVRTWGERVLCQPCLELAASGAPRAAASAPNPALAALLGFIPGVGAMYNGQLAKALAHVVIFAILVVLSHVSVIFALLVPAWVLYQVFEAYETAKARLEGKPVPDHLGLNQAGARWLGGSRVEVGSSLSPQPEPAPHGPQIQEPAADPPKSSREPVWAVVLIVIGLLLLAKTLGVFEANWLGRTWPLLLVLFGSWLLTRNLRAVTGIAAASARKTVSHAVSGPSFLILLGVLWSLDRWSALSFKRSWPLFLIWAGVLILFDRAAAAARDRRHDEEIAPGRDEAL